MSSDLCHAEGSSMRIAVLARHRSTACYAQCDCALVQRQGVAVGNKLTWP